MSGLGYDPNLLNGFYNLNDPSGVQVNAAQLAAAASMGGPSFDSSAAGVGVMANLPMEEHSPLYFADEFRMLYFKVLPCSKRYVHDWTTCPFAHTGEKARRRDPRLYNYTGIACPDMKKAGNCIRGDKCPYAHNVFEYWLHPTRYRTQLCNDGKGCARRVCFFAHTLDEVRLPKQKPYVSPEAVAAASLEALAEGGGLAAAAGLDPASSLVAPASGGSLYKSFSCPTYNQVTGNAAGMAFVAGGLGKVDENHAFPPVSMGGGGEHPSPSPSMRHPNSGSETSALQAASSSSANEGSVRGGSSSAASVSAGGSLPAVVDGELAGSLAALKNAVQQGKLPHEALMSLLSELLSPAGHASNSAAAATSQHAASAGNASGSGISFPSQLRQPSLSRDDMVVGVRGGMSSRPASLSSGSLPVAMPAGSYSNLPSGLAPGAADAELLAAAGLGIWQSASLPTGRIDRRSVAMQAAAVDCPSSAAAAAAAAAAAVAGPPAPSHPGVPEALNAALVASQGLVAADPVAQVLQQSAATQSSAAANGQASQEAKLAKAKNLTQWLNQLKRGGNSQSIAAAVNSGNAPPELEELQQQMHNLTTKGGGSSSSSGAGGNEDSAHGDAGGAQ